MEKKYTEKENLYLQAKKAYYESGENIMSDFEFDKLESELVALNSEVVDLVGMMDFGGRKVLHPSPMLSLDKITTPDDGKIPTQEILEWVSKYLHYGEIEVSPKFDGCAINSVYNSKNLEVVITRGRKEKGQDITHKGIHILPNSISDNRRIQVRGEIVIPTEVFKAKYAHDKANPRNFVSGILNPENDHPQAQACLKEDLIFISYDVKVYENGKWVSMPETFKWLKENGFNGKYTPELAYINQANGNEVEEVYKKMEDYRRNCPFQLDGFVLKTPESSREEIGEKTKYPNWAIAIKFDSEKVKTEILDYFWETGSSGRVTPTAILKPVNFDGSTVQRALVYNMGWLLQNPAGIGSEVILTKSGDIIPRIVEIVKFVGKPEFPTHCPTCKSLLNVGEIHLECPNDDCEAKGYRKLSEGVKILEILGIGTKACENLFDAGIMGIEDLFNPELFNEGYLTDTGIFKKGRSLEKILQAPFEIEMKIDAWKILAALKVDGIGSTASKAICQYLYNGIENFSNLEREPIFNFLGMNSSNQKSLYFERYENFKNAMILSGFEVIYPSKPTEVSEDTIVFEMTGVPSSNPKISKKADLQKRLEGLGWIWESGVSKKTTILITDDADGDSTKQQKAKKLGTKIQTYQEIYKLLGI